MIVIINDKLECPALPKFLLLFIIIVSPAIYPRSVSNYDFLV